jgi:hypothetical protein
MAIRVFPVVCVCVGSGHALIEILDVFVLAVWVCTWSPDDVNRLEFGWG